jgi:hypothetical protein
MELHRPQQLGLKVLKWVAQQPLSDERVFFYWTILAGFLAFGWFQLTELIKLILIHRPEMSSIL